MKSDWQVRSHQKTASFVVTDDTDDVKNGDGFIYLDLRQQYQALNKSASIILASLLSRS